jgi:hypothetical protein
MLLNPNHQNIMINLRSDDPDVQGNTDGDASLRFQFNRTIIIPQNYNLNVCVQSAEIPHSYYTFGENFYMAMSWNSLIYFYPIANKHWTPCAFANYINKLATVVGNDPPTWAFDNSTLKWTVTSTQSFTFQFLATATTTPKVYLADPLYRMICRFFGQPYTDSTFVFRSAIQSPFNYTSTNAADTSRHHTIALTSVILNTDSVDSQDAQSHHVLAKVPVNAPFGSLISYKGNLHDGYLYKNKSFNRVDIALRDHDGSLVDLNGTRFNITLLCQFVKKDPDIIDDMPPAMAYPVANPYGSMAGYQTPVQDSLGYKGILRRMMKRKGRGQ